MSPLASTVVVAIALALLTAVGGVRRGERATVALLGALLFPVTWVIWFVRDNRSAGRGAFQGR